MATAQQWIQAARPRTLPAAIAPVLVGVGAAARNAVCVNAGTGQNIAVTDVGTSDAPGFVTSAA